MLTHSCQLIGNHLCPVVKLCVLVINVRSCYAPPPPITSSAVNLSDAPQLSVLDVCIMWQPETACSSHGQETGSWRAWDWTEQNWSNNLLNYLVLSLPQYYCAFSVMGCQGWMQSPEADHLMILEEERVFFFPSSPSVQWVCRMFWNL